jgi:hypothetical protein
MNVRRKFYRRQSMSDVTEALLALAIAATPGPWEHRGASVASIATGYVAELSGFPHSLASLSATRGPEQRDRDAAFIAAANPSTVIALLGEIEALRKALERIERWFGEFPETGMFWDDDKKTRPLSYGAAFGSNGERDFMRAIARAALNGEKT